MVNTKLTILTAETCQKLAGVKLRAGEEPPTARNTLNSTLHRSTHERTSSRYISPHAAVSICARLPALENHSVADGVEIPRPVA